MSAVEPRLRAVCDLRVASTREAAGMHAYDGQVQDLSPAGISAGLARLGGHVRADPHDEAHLRAWEAGLRICYDELELHRWNPQPHIANLDTSCYDRDYAAQAERDQARRRHLAAWPDAVAASCAALDAVPAPVAAGLLGAARGLVAGLDLDPDDPVGAAALAAHRRFVAHLEHAAAHGPARVALGQGPLARMMGAFEALTPDLDALATRARTERDRLRGLLAEACARLRPGQELGEAVAALKADHPDATGVLDEARQLTAEVRAWTAASGLVPPHDGECLVGPAPPSRSWALAMLEPSGPWEPDGPSWYHITPPDPAWPPAARQQWLAVFNRTTLPAITVHEVAPGHFTHFRWLRQAASDVRRTLFSPGFVEGWAHDMEELALTEGFRAHDPAYAAGVALEGLVRVTRLGVAIGLHTGELDLPAAVRRFTTDAFLEGPAAASEAHRATFDPTYGRYTWGKWVIGDLRQAARQAWGACDHPLRLHRALLDLGAPPLGLASAVLAGSWVPGDGDGSAAADGPPD